MIETVQKLKFGQMPKFVATAVVIICIACWVIWKYESRETWPRLQQIDPSLSVLNKPVQLMNLASTFVGTNFTSNSEDINATVETRHEAIRALMNLQNKTFGIRTQPPSQRGCGIDHISCFPDSTATNVYLRLIGTPARRADIHATEGAYWSMESLDFDKDGRLVSRLAYNDPHAP